MIKRIWIGLAVFGVITACVSAPVELKNESSEESHTIVHPQWKLSMEAPTSFYLYATDRGLVAQQRAPLVNTLAISPAPELVTDGKLFVTVRKPEVLRGGVAISKEVNPSDYDSQFEMSDRIAYFERDELRDGAGLSKVYLNGIIEIGGDWFAFSVGGPVENDVAEFDPNFAWPVLFSVAPVS